MSASQPSRAARTDSPAVPDPAVRIRRSLRSEALQRRDLASLARAYAAGEDVHLGGRDFWRWERDGIPAWLLPHLRDLALLPWGE
jgi:hypothetical protein